MKNLLLALALTLAGCAELQEVRKAADPVAEHALPIAGDALQKLADIYNALCLSDSRPVVCDAARDALNKAIAHYNELNELAE